MVLHPRLLFIEVHIEVRGRGPQSSLQVPMFDAVKRKSVQIRPELVCKHLPGLRDSPQISSTKQADKIVPLAATGFVFRLPNLNTRLEVLLIGITWRQEGNGTVMSLESRTIYIKPGTNIDNRLRLNKQFSCSGQYISMSSTIFAAMALNLRHAHGTLPELWDTPTWVWRHGIPNETKYIWSKPLTEHKTRQISIYAQWNNSSVQFCKIRLLCII